MTKGLENAMNSEDSEKLFFYYKHDGAIDFEKKIIAGNILNERGFDRQKLLDEKQMIIGSIKDQIGFYENTDHIIAKNKRKINKGIFWGLGYIIFFVMIGQTGFLFNHQPIDWIGFSVMSLLVLIFITYKLMTYKAKLNQLFAFDMREKELLKLRLQFIEKEWSFQHKT